MYVAENEPSNHEGTKIKAHITYERTIQSALQNSSRITEPHYCISAQRAGLLYFFSFQPFHLLIILH